MNLLPRIASISCLLGAAIALSGCQLDLIEYGQRLQDEGRMVSRVQQMHPTAWPAMPETGSAQFNGTGNFYIDRVRETQGDGIFVLGDATLTADFAASTLTGEVTNFVGATNVVLNENDEVLLDGVRSVDVAGRIDLGQNESIIGNDAGTRTNLPNDWFMDYEGTLIANGETYALDGEIDGQFYGTRVNNPNTDVATKALAGAEELYSGSTATRESDGAVFDLGLAIIAEHDYRNQN